MSNKKIKKNTYIHIQKKKKKTPKQIKSKNTYIYERNTYTYIYERNTYVHIQNIVVPHLIDTSYRKQAT
jgi:hypothetical protein